MSEKFRLSTVSVIRFQGSSDFQVVELISFPDTQSGNDEAKNIFIDIANSISDIDEEDIDQIVDSGFFGLEGCNRGDSVALVHSESNAKDFVLINLQDILDQQESMQNDIMCILDGLENEIVVKVCQVIVDRMKILQNKFVAKD